MRFIGGRKTLFSLLPLALAACTAPTNDESPLAKIGENADIVATSQMAAGIGTGYDSAKEQFLLQCVKGTTVAGGVKSGHVTVDQTADKSTVTSSLGLTLGLKGRYSMFTADASASLNRSMTEDAYSESFVFYGDYDNGNITLSGDTYEMTELGKSALANGKWVETCGNEFVKTVSLGARFYFVLRVDFDSTDSKSKFDQAAKISATFGAGSVEVSDSLTMGMSAVSGHAHLHAEAMQLGGDPTKLGTIFKSNQTSTDPSKPVSASAVLECAGGTISACVTFMSSALDYASSSNPGSLQDQLNDASKFAPTGYSTVPWSALNIQSNPVILTQELANERSLLSAKFERIATARMRVERILNDGFVLPAGVTTALQSADNDLAIAQGLVNSAVSACYDALKFDSATGLLDPNSVTACTNAVTAIKDTTVDPELLNGAATYEIDEKANLMTFLGAPQSGFGVTTAGANPRDCTSQFTPKSTGKFCSFTGGTVYWQPDLGAFEVDGTILNRYNASFGAVGGGPEGALGFPKTDVSITADGRGHVSTFQLGSIYATPLNAVVASYGTIGQYYDAHGGSSGPLGYPRTEPKSTTDFRGQYAVYDNGAIVTSTTPGTGTHVINTNQEALWLSTYGTATSLGFPTSDDTQDPAYGGDFASFQMGTIATSGSGTAFLQSDMTAKWRQDIGILGYPVSNEVQETRAGVKHAQFLRGWIYNINGVNYTLDAGVFGAWANTWGKAWGLDLPAGDNQDTTFNAHGAGKQQSFGGGMIYTGPGTGSHAVSGAILYNLRLRPSSSSAEYNCGWPTGDMMLGSQYFHVASTASPGHYIDSYGSKIDDWYIQPFQNGWLAATLDQKHAYVHCGGRNGRM